jgi:hypothetical protein
MNGCSGQFSNVNGSCRTNQNIILPQVNFSTFLLSLNTSALTYMGLLPNPETGNNEKDICLAKHTIDTISMLYEKTKNNLNDDETQLLKNLLYELRILFVKHCNVP